MVLTAVLAWSAPAAAQEVSWATTSEGSVPPPDVLAGPLRAVLFQESTDIRRGKSLIRVWGVRSLAITSSTPDWSHVPPGSLIGAMQTEAPLPDIRGVPIAPGVYTLRFAMQPQDGDHLGVSPYRQFLVVAPAAEDSTPDPVGHDRAVQLGKKTHGRSHPAIMSIDPPIVQNVPAARVMKTEEGHTAVVAGVECTHDGKPVGALAFGVVLVGRIDH